MTENKSVFETLNSVDVSSKIKSKNKLAYLPWASAWAEVKKRYPDATYDIGRQIMDEYGNTRFWHDDGHTGWVEVSMTISGNTEFVNLPIMDFKNNSIQADQITSTDANKALMRCLVKACALHGLGLYIYEGEDLPEETSMTIELKERIREIVKKKVALSESAKDKVAELCKAAEREYDPNLPDEMVTGNYNNIESVEILSRLEKQLLTVRK